MLYKNALLFAVMTIYACYGGGNLYCQIVLDSMIEKVVSAHESHLAKIDSLKASVLMVCEYHQANQEHRFTNISGVYYYTPEVSRTSIVQDGMIVDEYIRSDAVYRFEKSKDGKLKASKGKQISISHCDGTRASLLRLQIPNSSRYAFLREFLLSSVDNPSCKQFAEDGSKKYRINCNYKAISGDDYQWDVSIVINPTKNFLIEQFTSVGKKNGSTVTVSTQVTEFSTLTNSVFYPHVTISKVSSEENGLSTTIKWKIDKTVVNQPIDKTLFSMPFASTITLFDNDKRMSYKVDGQGNQVSVGKELKTAMPAPPIKALDTPLIRGSASERQDNTNYLQWGFIVCTIVLSITALYMIVMRNRVSQE